MVSKNGFIPNVRRQNLPRAAKMFKNTPINGPNGLNVMFNASQIPDNPGYMDFSNPTPPIPTPNSGINKKMPHTGGNRPHRNIMPQRNIGEPHRNNWMGGRNVRGAPIRPNHAKFSGRGGNRQFNGIDMPRRLMPPIPPMPMRGPMPPIPIQPMNNRFNAMPPPMMRNNMPGPRPGPPMPPIPPPMMRRTRNAPLPPPPPPPMRRPNPNNAIPPPLRVMKHKRNGKPIKFSNAAHKNEVPSKKTLKEIVNQYPLDKPWVTAEIRQEHAKKEDIENRLKGKKNDALFAEFKIQRDKFVALYESARDKHVELEAAKSKVLNSTFEVPERGSSIQINEK